MQFKVGSYVFLYILVESETYLYLFLYISPD